MMRSNTPAQSRYLMLLLVLALLPIAAHAAPPEPFAAPYADAMRSQFTRDEEEAWTVSFPTRSLTPLAMTS